jgi:hypothetical protein
MVSKKKLKIISLAGLVLAIYVYFSDYTNGPILPCIFNKITKLYCPGCGMTRAINSILRLRFYQALRFNSLIFIIPPLMVLYFLTYKKYKNFGKILIVLMIIISLGYGILRNIPSFDFLAPTIVWKL